jgi:hypothetical protein
MAIGCETENCTVAETNICILENPPDSCPHRKKIADGGGPPSIEPPLGQPEQNPRLPHSRTLTPTQARDLMGARYCTLVGILGDPDAGKTAALVSLYLLISRAKLKGFDFRDSRTLMAFNEISQGALDWNEGQLPDQLTQHTELADDRTAGFLHLRLRRDEDGEALDFLLSDLPGEWSTSFVDKDRKDRLQFLKRADVIWLMMDGTQLRDPSQRHWAIHRMNLLIERLSATIGVLPPMVLVLTRRDDGEVPASAFESVMEEARQHGVELSVIQIASFADEGTVRPGFGIDLLMEACRSKSPEASPCWPVSEPGMKEARAMLRYRCAEYRE